MKTIKSFLCLIPFMLRMMPSAAVAADFETPPVLRAAEVVPEGVSLKGERYRIDDDAPTDGFLITYTIRSDFGTIEARGPGVLEARMNELRAIEELAAIEKTDVFVTALKESASSMGGAVMNIATNTKEVLKAAPESVGRFFKRVGRQAVTAGQKLGDVYEGRDPGAAEGAAPSENPQNIAVAGGVAAGTAVRDFLGYDEQRRGLARKLQVDPYTTNPVLKKQLDDIAWAAFAGGLGLDVVATKIPGGRLVQSTTVLSDLIYEKPPGDLKVWMENALKEMGVEPSVLDHFLRLNSFNLSTQMLLVYALNAMEDVPGRDDVIRFAITLDTADEARYLAVSMSMLAREHAKSPLHVILDGRPIGLTQKGTVVVCAAADYVSWTEPVADFVGMEEFANREVELHLAGMLTPRAKAELKERGWRIEENTPAL